MMLHTETHARITRNAIAVEDSNPSLAVRSASIEYENRTTPPAMLAPRSPSMHHQTAGERELLRSNVRTHPPSASGVVTHTTCKEVYTTTL